MSEAYTLFYYFGIYLIFMLVFFLLLCLICVLCLLWFRRRVEQEYTDTSEPREDTPMKKPALNDF